MFPVISSEGDGWSNRGCRNRYEESVCIGLYTIYPLHYNRIRKYIVMTRTERGGGMEGIELLQKNIEDFSRVQDWMQLAEKDSRVYQAMRRRYMELKVILTASGINLTELDMIKE